MRVSVQASLSSPGFYEQTLWLHMGCIISTSPLWESAAINASAPRCDKPLPSACICIGYQLRGCNNRIGHRLTCIRGKALESNNERKRIGVAASLLHTIHIVAIFFFFFFAKNVTAITFNTAVKTKRGLTPHQRHMKIYTSEDSPISHSPSALLSGTAGRSSELGEHPSTKRSQFGTRLQAAYEQQLRV